MEQVNIEIILGRTGKVIGNDIASAFFMLAFFAGLGTLADVEGLNLNIGFNIASVVAQYYLIRRLCERRGLIGEGGPGGFGSFFGLAGLGTLLGLVLLVVPGLYLAARWSVGGVALIAERRSASDALGESWRLTADHVVAIALATLIVWLPGIAGVGAAFWFGDDAGHLPAAASAIMNLGLFGSMM